MGFNGSCRRLAAVILLCAVGVLSSGCDLRDLIYVKTTTSEAFFRLIVDEWKWELHKFDSTPEIRLVGVEKAPVSETSPWVYFFGGNANPIGGSAWGLDRSKGDFDRGMFAYAYRGYDGSTGKATEEALVADAVRVYKDVLKRRALTPERLYLMGHSLGSGIATQVAAKLESEGIRPAGLILVSPFTCLKDAAVELVPGLPAGLLVPDRLDTRGTLPILKLPVLIIHGTADVVISVDHGRQLARKAGRAVKYIELPQTGHNDIFLNPAMPAILGGFIR